jgi:hypothetical protein
VRDGKRAGPAIFGVNNLVAARNLIAAYFVIGAFVCFVHPLLLRKQLRELRSVHIKTAGIIVKPLMALLIALLYFTLWPIAWFNAGRSEKKAKEVLAAQLDRLRPLANLYAAVNSPVRYAGGDGSSFENAVVILAANQLSGVRAQYDYLDEYCPGYRFRRQSIKEHTRRRFSVIELATAAGDDKAMYFDISAYL